MKITILTIGSLGDVQPYVALGLGLQSSGHTVKLATSHSFADFITSWGLGFASVEGDFQTLLKSELGQNWLESGQNPMHFFSQFVQLMQPFIEKLLVDSFHACQGTDAIIYSPLAFGGYSIAEQLGVPSYLAALQPSRRTRAFPNLLTPVNLNLGGTYNWLTYIFVEQLFWQLFQGSFNQWRQSTLNLPPFPWFGPMGQIQQQKVPFLYGYSSTVLPKPDDWPDWTHITGYWFLDHPSNWQPPADLVDFLESGTRPVYVGFGSMNSRNPEALTELVLKALTQTRQRGILSTGWGGISNSNLPDHIFKVESVPHDWLFPKMAAVVHHGGAGTTAAGIRAGVPSITIPFFGDQPFWGQRVARLGVGPEPILQNQLTVERLTVAIDSATSNRSMLARAVALSKCIQAEDGVLRAVEAFHYHLP